MDCDRIRELVQTDLDGLLSAEDKAELQGHLAGCSGCTIYAVELRKTMSGLKGLDQLEPPPWLAPKVMNRIRQEQQGKRGLMQRLFYPLHIKVPIEAMAVILIAALAVVVMREMGPVTETIVPAPQVLAEKKTGQKPAETKKPASQPRRQEEQFRDDAKHAEEFTKQKTEPIIAEKGMQDRTGQTYEHAATETAPKAGKAETAMKAAPAAPMQRSVGAAMPERYEEIRLIVTDVDQAAEDVTEIFRGLGGSVESVVSSDGKLIVQADLTPERDNDMKNRLRKIGRIRPAQPSELKKTGKYRILLEKS